MELFNFDESFISNGGGMKASQARLVRLKDEKMGPKVPSKPSGGTINSNNDSFKGNESSKKRFDPYTYGTNGTTTGY